MAVLAQKVSVELAVAVPSGSLFWSLMVAEKKKDACLDLEG